MDNSSKIYSCNLYYSKARLKKEVFSCEWICCSIGIPVFSYMTAWYRWSYFIITPAVFRLVYATETGFILKDYSYSFIRVNVSNFFYFGVDFFEAWIASLFAFLRCLLSGILFLNSCLFNTYYIWPLPTGCPTNSIYAFSISLAVIACPFSAVSSNCFKNSFSCSKDKFLLFPGLFYFSALLWNYFSTYSIMRIM